MIYVVTSGRGLYKIGTTHGVLANRIKELQCGCPSLITAVCTGEGSYAEEARLHREFINFRVQGEWFNLSKKNLEKLIRLVSGDLELSNPYVSSKSRRSKLASEKWARRHAWVQRQPEAKSSSVSVKKMQPEDMW